VQSRRPRLDVDDTRTHPLPSSMSRHAVELLACSNGNRPDLYGGMTVNDLVQRLSEGSHPVEVSLRPERTIKLFREMLDRKHVLVKFTGTRGGTELGFPLDESRSDLSQADLEAQTGKIRVCGELTLDYVPVRVVADIELPSLEGQGHLEILGEEKVA
jgi:hypothetical protein